MSGTTRSIPNISSSGNMSPQSMTTMSSPYSNTYMFLPISPTPPSGMMRRGRSGPAIGSWDSEERDVGRDVGIASGRGRGRDARGGGGCSTAVGSSAAGWPPRRRRSRASRSARGISATSCVALALDLRRAERGGRVVERERHRAGGARRRVDRADGAVGLRDPLAGHEPAQRVPAERDDQGRVEDLELALEVRRAGRDLVGLRVAVVRRPALDDVRDEDLVALPARASRGTSSRRSPARPTNGRPSRSSWNPGPSPTNTTSVSGLPSPGTALVRVSWSRQRVQARTCRRDVVERSLALVVGHADPPTAAGTAAAAVAASSARYGAAPRAWRGPDPAAGERAPRRSGPRSWPRPCGGCR